VSLRETERGTFIPMRSGPIVGTAEREEDPFALAQCRAWLQHPVRLLPCFDFWKGNHGPEEFFWKQDTVHS
jgi:hypothetical protein